MLTFIEFNSLFANIDKHYIDVFGSDNMRIYITFLLMVLGDEFSKSTLHVKAKLLDLLFIFNFSNSAKTSHYLKEQLKTRNSKSIFLNALFKFFVSIEFMNDYVNIRQSKYRYRYFMSKFLNKAFQEKDFQESLQDNCQTQELSNFIGHVLTDLNFFLEDTFENFYKIKEEMQKLRMNPNQQNEDNEDNPRAKIEKLKSQCQVNLDLGRANLNMLSHLIRLVPKEFGNAQWCTQTATVINLYANKMSSKNYKQYQFQGIQELGLKPLKFISTLIEIYAHFENVDPLLKEVAADERSYSREMLIDIGSTAHHKKLLPQETLKAFERVINKLDEIQEEQKNLLEIIGNDYPERFNCGLTYDIMKDPVKLKTSDVIVDRRTIEKQIVLNGEVDPFNRTTLKKSDLVPQVKLKAEIDAWMEQKIKLYRAKYGKKKKATGTLLEKNNDVYGNHENNDDDGNAFYKNMMN